LPYYIRGNAYTGLQQYEKAISDYIEAIIIDSEYANAYYSRANAYEQLGNKQKAFEDYQHAAELYQKQGNTQAYQDTLNRIQNLQ
jgi:tetratricopeptide (TPR) repeat protein